ncbi:MAG: class III poly(R)-hydroxyalkanoic acid synthase subunit PhaE [Dokdonella sp.]
MADTPNPDWMNQWQALARQYANNWQNAAQSVPAASQAHSATPGFEQWSQLMARGPSSQGETIERLVGSAKSYAAYMQSLFATASANPQGSNLPWGNAFAQGFANPSTSSPLFEHPAARAWREMAAQGGPDFASFAASLQAPPTADLSELKTWLKLPTFGSSREQQEHYQKAAVAAVEYQEQMNRYNALMMKASQRGFELFEGKLAEREQPGRQVESLRALYDLWVDAAEEGYAEIALSIEFREVYGALVNAQMRVRSLSQHGIEHFCAEVGMPTRSEVNSIGERLQALRREVRARGDDSLAGEIAALREEFAAFKGKRKSAQRDAEAVERTPVAMPRKATVTGKRATKSKTEATKKVPVAAKADPSKKKATKQTAPTKRPRSATTKKAMRRNTAASAQAAAEAPTPGSRNFASRIAKFANASLGTSRARARQPEQRTKSRSAKAR